MLRGRLQGFEEPDSGFRGQVFVVVVVDLDHGGVDAGAEALDFGEGEEFVRRRLARVNAEVGADGFHDEVGTAATELAGSLSDGWGSALVVMHFSCSWEIFDWGNGGFGTVVQAWT